MRAVILAAGKGTRMRELTSDLPKPMLKVQGKPILEHILEGVRAAGVGEFCIITGYRAEVVESCLATEAVGTSAFAMHGRLCRTAPVALRRWRASLLGRNRFC